MKDIKIQIRVAVETREEWKRLAAEQNKTLTQYIVDKVEEAGVAGEKVSIKEPSAPVARVKVKKAKRGLKELPSQNMGGFRTYFK